VGGDQILNIILRVFPSLIFPYAVNTPRLASEFGPGLALGFNTFNFLSQVIFIDPDGSRTNL